jgi:hypothetical protein
MNNKIFQTIVCSLHVIFATLLLTLSTSIGLVAQCPSPKLCDRLSLIQPSSSTIDLNTTTNTMPNHPSIPPIFNYKYAKKRLVLVANMVTVTNNLVEFNDCDIRIAEDGGFTVPAGKALVFNNCRIAAMDCSKLWNGIILTGGSLKMTNGNHVEDAKGVINMFSASTLICENNLFNRNYVGLAITSFAGTTKFSFKGNTIQKDCRLIPSQGRAIVGVSSSLSTAALDLIDNNFIGLGCGVRTFKSNINIKGGSFININDDNSKQPGVGCGVFSEQSKFIRIDNATFDACLSSGVKVSDSNLECRNSIFQNVKYNGILITGESTDKNQIIRNTFSGHDVVPCEYISIDDFGGAEEFITDNIFNLEAGATTSHFSGITAVTTSGGRIARNTFNGTYPLVNGGRISTINIAGIRYTVEDNRINANVSPLCTPFETRGISLLFESDGANVRQNYIHSNLDIGLFCNETPYSTICSNWITQPKTGLKVSGFGEFTEIVENNFSNNSKKAMLFDGELINMGTQSHRGNRFNQGSVEHTGSDSKDSRFIVNPFTNTSCGDANLKPSNVIPPDWFEDKDDCIAGCPQYKVANNSASAYDIKVATRTLGVYDYTNTQIWTAEYNLFTKLKAQPSLLNNSALNVFYEETNASNKAAFLKVQNKIKEALTYDNGIKALSQSHNRLFQQAILKYAEWQTDTTNNTVWLEYVGINEQILNTQSAYETALASHKSNKNEILQSANAINTSISSVGEFEIKLKTINQLIIKYLLGERLDEAEWNTVNQIAQICIQNGGRATNIAQYLLLLNHQFVEYNNQCSGGSSGRIKSNVKSNNDITIYPNPVSQQLQIACKDAYNRKLGIQIYDISGHLLLSQTLDSQDLNTLDVSYLKNGFYLFHILENSNLISTQRFVKID